MGIALALYAVVAAVFLMQTLKEGTRKLLPWNGYRLLGVALSIAWPAALVVCIVMILGARDERDAR